MEHKARIKQAMENARKLSSIHMSENAQATSYYKGMWEALTWVLCGIDEDLFTDEELAIIPLWDFKNKANCTVEE